MEFTGLVAFPLTPLREGRLDEDALGRNVERLAASGVDAVAVLGSTGAGAYLDRAERARTVHAAVRSAGGVPVLAGVSALRTEDVLRHADDAADAGAAGLVVSPMTYQPLTEDEVVGLYEDVSATATLPVVLYDNPTTTHVVMSPGTYGRITALPNVRDVKIPGVPGSEEEIRARVQEIRAHVSPGTGLGISGDAVAAAGLLAGCDAWHSVLAGTVPETAVPLARAALSAEESDRAWARGESQRLEPLWALMRTHGSLRVVAALGAERGWVEERTLPRPLRPLPPAARAEAADVGRRLGLL